MSQEFPWQLTDETVWLLMTERFNDNEIAHVFGVSRMVARAAMVRAARSGDSRETTLHLPAEAA